jgi:hypothetical protein
VRLDMNVAIAIGATRGVPLHGGRATAWSPPIGRIDADEPSSGSRRATGRTSG